MMNKPLVAAFACMALFVTSCVSKKKLAQAETSRQETQALLDKAKVELNDCETRVALIRRDMQSRESELTGKVKELEGQLDYLKKTNTNLLDRLSDLSIVSKTGAENIRKSLDAINDQSRYIRDLNQNLQRKDSLNLALVMNLKRSLSDINDEDVQVEVKKGVVYVSLSDKLLFKSGSDVINPAAETVLAKVAQILNDYDDMDILIEGHTDNVPISTACIQDNWDLSVKRATSVARTLQNKFSVNPTRLTAGGRSEYMPKADNAVADNRKLNRRTEIIITPKLDQFFNLLTPQPGTGSR